VSIPTSGVVLPEPQPPLPVNDGSLSTNISEKQKVSVCAGQLAVAADTYKLSLHPWVPNAREHT